MPAEWMTAREVAAIFRVDPGTIHRFARSGAIPSVRLSRRVVRFQLPAVVEAMSARARAPREAQPEAARPEGVAS